jgi:hypothetical protein
MLKRIGTFALLLSATAAFVQPATAFAHEHHYRDRDYPARHQWNGSSWRDHRDDERWERRRHRERGDREHWWREHNAREHKWRERERAERRYDNRYRNSPYTDNHYYPY